MESTAPTSLLISTVQQAISAYQPQPTNPPPTPTTNRNTCTIFTLKNGDAYQVCQNMSWNDAINNETTSVRLADITAWTINELRSTLRSQGLKSFIYAGSWNGDSYGTHGPTSGGAGTGDCLTFNVDSGSVNVLPANQGCQVARPVLYRCPQSSCA
ncbi:hypothetical protein HDU76_003121 [Blyttiomyces sp. JEL0837]|nr:hypothetical protein HDU76_003121 [Blyttiomyces sp. JEL0837]